MKRALILISFFSALCLAKEPPDRRLILLVTVDSLRSSFLGAYGAEPGATPRIDELAASSHVFKHAYATSSWTLPSIMSLFTSLTIDDHFITGPQVKAGKRPIAPFADRVMRLPASYPLFHEAIVGYSKGAFLTNPLLSRRSGLCRGWDVYEDLPWPTRNDKVSITPRANLRILKFIDESSSNRLFVWVHYNDVHLPYGPASRYIREFYPGVSEAELRDIDSFRKSRDLILRNDPRRLGYIKATYQAGLKQFDEHFGALLGALKQRGLYDSALIVLTADHGEEFREHGAYGHGINLYDATLSIPLLVKLPRQKSRNVIDKEVSLIDIGPTILDAAQSPIPPLFAGASLMPLLHGKAAKSRPQFGILYEKHDKLLHSVVHRRMKLIVTHETQGSRRRIRAGTRKRLLFDLKRDPRERSPLPLDGANTVKVKELETLLLAKIRTYDLFAGLPEAGKKDGSSVVNAESEKVLEQLKALGYVE